MNLVGNLINSYYTLLNNNVSGFGIYKLTVPESERGNFVLISPDSGEDDNNKDKRVEKVVVRIDIVTNFNNDTSQVSLEFADETIRALISPSIGDSILSTSLIEVRNIERKGYQYSNEVVGTDLVYRKTSRYEQRVIEL